jgi:hypothetical protein
MLGTAGTHLLTALPAYSVDPVTRRGRDRGRPDDAAVPAGLGCRWLISEHREGMIEMVGPAVDNWHLRIT